MELRYIQFTSLFKVGSIFFPSGPIVEVTESGQISKTQVYNGMFRHLLKKTAGIQVVAGESC